MLSSHLDVQLTQELFILSLAILLQLYVFVVISAISQTDIFRVSLLGAFAKLRLLASSCQSLCLSVRPSARNNWSATGRIFMKFDIEYF